MGFSHAQETLAEIEQPGARILAARRQGLGHQPGPLLHGIGPRAGTSPGKRGLGARPAFARLRHLHPGIHIVLLCVQPDPGPGLGRIRVSRHLYILR
jgi:hypothetical protein